MTMKPPVILDCDGVLLDWETAFREWVDANHFDVVSFNTPFPEDWDLSKWIGCSEDEAWGLIRSFNHSEAFGRLKPMPGAERLAYNLQCRDFPIYIVTSCSSAPEVRKRREDNVRWFGGVERTICLDLGVSKRDTLQAFNTVLGECVWVEDNFQNAIDGYAAGHRSFFLHRPHNRKFWNEGSGQVTHLENLLDLVSLI